jgi:hypothetical protein
MSHSFVGWGGRRIDQSSDNEQGYAGAQEQRTDCAACQFPFVLLQTEPVPLGRVHSGAHGRTHQWQKQCYDHAGSKQDPADHLDPSLRCLHDVVL